MLRDLKPYAGPLVLFAIERAWEMLAADGSDPLIAGIIFGLAGFWLVLALFSNRKLLQNFPSILEWAPFLDPSGAFATPKQLTAAYLSSHSLQILDITHGSQILNRTFVDCDIYGPAVLTTTPTTNFINCVFDAPTDRFTIRVTQEKVIGVIRIDNCKFDRCRFHNIALIGTPELLEKVRAGTTDV